MKNIQIDDIVYVLNPSPPKLIPGRIVEQIISRKIDGEHVKHIVEFSTGKTYTLEKIKKPWFTSLHSAKSYLISEAEKLVSSVVEDGKKQSDLHFPGLSIETEIIQQPIDIASINEEKEEYQHIQTEESVDPISLSNSEEISDGLVIDLGNGQSGRVKLNIPESLK